MFRRAKSEQPAEEIRRLARILQPSRCYPWTNLAMHYLGVPILIGQHFVVVQDEDHEACIQRLKNAKLVITVPDRSLHPDITATLPNPEEVKSQIMAEQLFLVPNSFACIQRDGDFDVYDNIHLPLERTLIESFVRCILLEGEPGFSAWGGSLTTSIETMTRYLEINKDILDLCKDHRSVEWFSKNFGRKHEAKYGPPDFRISKRIGSGKELPINSRGQSMVSGNMKDASESDD